VSDNNLTHGIHYNIANHYEINMDLIKANNPEVIIMKICQNCRLSFQDDTTHCPKCGETLIYVPDQNDYRNITDHTAEFTAEDISQNKVLAMAPYIMGWIGIIIALLAAGTSPYAAFHVKQALKIQIIAFLSVILNIVPIIGWIAFAISAIILVVVQIICFLDVCNGSAKEPPIICNFKFLK